MDSRTNSKNFLRKIVLITQKAIKEWNLHRLNTILRETNEKTKISALQRFGLRDGFSDNQIRKKVWPLLTFNLSRPKNEGGFSQKTTTASKELPVPLSPPQVDVEQIQVDAKRSFIVGQNRIFADPELQKEYQFKLETLLIKMFRKEKKLSYTQGLHEFCSFLLLVCDERKVLPMSQVLVENYYRDFLVEDLGAMKGLLHFIMSIIEQTDIEVYQKISAAKVDSFFSLSWLLTWLSHDCDSVQTVLETYDFILSSNMLMPYYLCAARVIFLRKAILDIPLDDCDSLLLLLNKTKISDNHSLYNLSLKLYRLAPPHKILSSIKSFEIPKSSALMSNIIRSKDEAAMRRSKSQFNPYAISILVVLMAIILYFLARLFKVRFSIGDIFV